MRNNRICGGCGKQLVKKYYSNGVLESDGQFERRKFCDRSCMAKGFTGRIISDDPSWYTAHKRARDICKDKTCALCGSEFNIDVHHKDGNWKNNNPDNLEALCRSCHIKEHRGGRKCTICNGKHKGLGFCDKHYQRFKKYGDPHFKKEERGY